MPALPDRDALEAELARVVGSANAYTRRELLLLLGDPPDLDKLTLDVWETIARRYGDDIAPLLKNVFVRSLTAAAEDINVGLAWDLVNERAVSWAQQYTYDLVQGINETSQQWIADAVTHFYEGRLDEGELMTRLSTIFGPERAEAIAITEVTRAASAGQMEFQRELNDMGIVTQEVWQTTADEIAKQCPICGPNHMMPRGRWTVDEPPPGHPRCRCWVTIEVLTPELVT